MNRIALAGLVAGAVALVTVPVAVMASDRSDPEGAPPRPAPSQSAAPTESAPDSPSPSATESPSERPDDRFSPATYDDWRATVPADLTVSDGLPADGGDVERSAEALTGHFCGNRAFPVDGVLDARRDGAVGPEYADLRDLRVYVDDVAAHRVLVRARDVVRDCSEEEHGGTLWLHQATDADLGDEAVRVVRTYETDGMVNLGATFWHLVRVGNAVLLTEGSGEYLAGETLGQGIATHQRTFAPIVDRMCSFGAAGCPAPGDIPDDFPLAAGWPADDVAESPRLGLSGPDRSLEPMSLTACERTRGATGANDRLRADWANVEDFRARELVTFEDADAAVAFTASLVDLWRGCPREDNGPGYELANSVRRTGVGGESWALLRWNEHEGAPAIGLTVVHVTRLGRAVLIDQASNEGSRRSADEQVAGQVSATAPIVAAMCRFTEAGC